jgi:hypothetical protein
MNEEINPRDFEKDLEASNNPSLRENWLRIFKLKFGEDIKVSWKDDVELQKGLGTDITITTKQGRRYSIELKTRTNSCLNKDWIMEIISHVYDKKEKPNNHLFSKEGWIYSTTAEYIFHGTLDKSGNNIEKWKGEFNKYEVLWLSTLYPNGNFQWTINKLIPEEVIKKDALEFWRWQDED